MEEMKDSQFSINIRSDLIEKEQKEKEEKERKEKMEDLKNKELSKNILEEKINIFEENNVNNLNSWFKPFQAQINFFENNKKKNKAAINGSHQYQPNEFPRLQTPNRVNRSSNQFSYNRFMNQNKGRNIEESNQSDRNIDESNQLSLPTESQVYQTYGTIPAPEPNYLMQNMEQINLLRMIFNSINNNINQGII